MGKKTLAEEFAVEKIVNHRVSKVV